MLCDIFYLYNTVCEEHTLALKMRMNDISNEYIIYDDSEEDETEIVAYAPPKERLLPPPTNDMNFSFYYLKELYSITEVMSRVVPPSTFKAQMRRMFPRKGGPTPLAARKWYEMWFHMANPNSTFEDQYNACYEALCEWEEPRGFTINPNLIQEEIRAADLDRLSKEYRARKDAIKYDVDEKYLINRIHTDGKDRSNPRRDPQQFHYSFLRTTIEAMDVDTSTKVGSSRHPICKVIYHQNEWLNSTETRNTDPSKYRLELFIGPFISEDQSRTFNKIWRAHRGAQPRRNFAMEYANDRQMLCVDMRSVQDKKYIEALRIKKKSKKEISFSLS